jgi:hypothetical protein
LAAERPTTLRAAAPARLTRDFFAVAAMVVRPHRARGNMTYVITSGREDMCRSRTSQLDCPRKPR